MIRDALIHSISIELLMLQPVLLSMHQVQSFVVEPPNCEVDLIFAVHDAIASPSEWHKAMLSNWSPVEPDRLWSLWDREWIADPKPREMCYSSISPPSRPFQLRLTQNCVVISMTNINSGIDRIPTTIDQLNSPQDKPYDGKSLNVVTLSWVSLRWILTVANPWMRIVDATNIMK